MLSAIPLLSSNAISTNKIFLDFDGHITSEPYWQTRSGLQTIHSAAYDIDGIVYDNNGTLLPNAFSLEELDNIERAWQIISEAGGMPTR